jgi:hypothetical protein
MIAYLLLRSIERPLQTSPFVGRRAQEKAILMQKMNHMRKQIAELREQTNQISQDQAKMLHTAFWIQQDQEEIDKEQKDLKFYQDQMDQNAIQIHQNHNPLKLQALILNYKWETIFSQTMKIRNDQKEMQLKLQDMDQKRGDIHQHALIICQNIPLIYQNLQETRQNMKTMHHQGIRIQQDHQAMKIKVKAIEEKHYNIQDKISHLQLELTENNSLKQFEHAITFLEDQKLMKVASFDFWSSLLTKIKNLSLWIMLELKYQIEQAASTLERLSGLHIS